MDIACYRPVCLLDTVYKVLSGILTDRLYRLCEKHGLLDPSQEGFRRLRSTQRQVQGLHWAIEEKARLGVSLYLAFLDLNLPSTARIMRGHGGGYESSTSPMLICCRPCTIRPPRWHIVLT